MSQILAGVSSGAKALDPSDVGIRVKSMKQQQKLKKPAGGHKKKDRPGTEERPIIVGESSDRLKHGKLYTYRIRK